MQTNNLTTARRPLLTIAIPTYNRGDSLELCLNRVNEEISGLNTDLQSLVCVYISNNASTDNTCDVITKYLSVAAGTPRVVHNHVNIGGERNVMQCYVAALSEHVWILGDDDVILPGGLEKVMQVLLQGEVDMIRVNNYGFTENYQEERPSFETHGIINCRGSLDFARRVNVNLTFISGLIVRAGVNLERAFSVVEGSNLPQLGWVLPSLLDGKKFVCIDDFIVAAKTSNSGGYELVKVFGANLKRISEHILKSKPKVSTAIENGTIVNFFPHFILDFRSGQSKFLDTDMSANLKTVFGGNWRYYVFLMPLIYLPLRFAKHYRKFLQLLCRLGGFI